MPKVSLDISVNISLKADFEEAWPTIQQLYEEIDSSAMEGTGMTKLFQTLLNSVPPRIGEGHPTILKSPKTPLPPQLNKANSNSHPCSGAGTVLQFAVARQRVEHVQALLQHGWVITITKSKQYLPT